MRRVGPMALLWLLSLTAPGAVRAADFDINGPTVELRRVQFCLKCKKALLVTTVPPGARIQCPNCDTIQTRIPSDYLLTRVFQVCPRCGARMKVDHFQPGTLIRCGTCGCRQRVLYDAVHEAAKSTGTGWLPNMPEVPAEILPPESRPKKARRGPASDASLPLEPGPELADEPLPTLAQERLTASTAVVGPAEHIMPPGLPPDFRPTPNRVRATAVPLAEDRTGDILAPTPAAYGEAPSSARPRSAVDTVAPLRVVASVNGESVYAADLAKAVTKAMDETRVRLGPAALTAEGRALLARKKPAFRKQALEMLINRKLLLQAAAREGVRIPMAEVTQRADMLRRHAPAQAQAAELLDEARFDLTLHAMARQRREPGLEATPQQVRAYYQAHRREFMQPRRAALRGLVLFLDREGRKDRRPAHIIAREIVAAMQKGTSFRDLIYTYSEEPCRDQGGALQLGGNTLVPSALLATPVQEALEEARPGKIVGPIFLHTCIAFLLPEEIRAAEPLPLSAVGSQIQSRLTKQAQRAAFDRWVRDLRQQADVRVF